jgi:hypothetical protein
MRMWDWMTGGRPAPKGVKAESVAKLRARLMDINREPAAQPDDRLARL